MTRKVLTVIAVLTIVIAGCDNPNATWQYPPLSTTTRPSAVPPLEEIALATDADTAAAANVASDPAVSNAVGDYLEPGAPRWNVSAARDIGEYILLWVRFPEIMDGGIDLVYSKADRRVKWQFRGGERG